MKPKARPKRRKIDPVKSWVNGLARYRPGLADDTLAALASMYGTPVWQRVHDPTSELILTILSANSADINAERAFDELSRRWPSLAGNATIDEKIYRPGWGGVGIGHATPDWAGSRVRRHRRADGRDPPWRSGQPEGAAHTGFAKPHS
jgi:hypothetical protein